jgi:hypothetical protein
MRPIPVNHMVSDLGRALLSDNYTNTEVVWSFMNPIRTKRVIFQFRLVTELLLIVFCNHYGHIFVQIHGYICIRDVYWLDVNIASIACKPLAFSPVTLFVTNQTTSGVYIVCRFHTYFNALCQTRLMYEHSRHVSISCQFSKSSPRPHSFLCNRVKCNHCMVRQSRNTT